MVPLVENGLPPAGEHQGTEDREVTGDIGTRHSDRKSQPEPEEHRWEGRVGEEQERKPLRPPPPTVRPSLCNTTS